MKPIIQSIKNKELKDFKFLYYLDDLDDDELEINDEQESIKINKIDKEQNSGQLRIRKEKKNTVIKIFGISLL